MFTVPNNKHLTVLLFLLKYYLIVPAPSHRYTGTDKNVLDIYYHPPSPQCHLQQHLLFQYCHDPDLEDDRISCCSWC